MNLFALGFAAATGGKVALASGGAAAAGEAAPAWVDPLRFAILTAVVLTAAVFDWRTRKVPNALLLPAVLAGFAVALAADLAGGSVGPQVRAAAVAFFGGLIPFFILFVAGGVGGGDAKLVAAIGAMSAKWQVVIAAVFYGYLLLFVFSVIIMVRRRLVIRTVRRIAGAAMMAAAKVDPELGKDSPRIAAALGLAVGAVLGGLEYLLDVTLPWGRL
jgi:Flp pilus assembly protein protease CpaA